MASAVTAWACAAGVVSTLRGPEPDVAVLGTLLAVLGPLVAGRLLARQRRQTAMLRELTARLENERATAQRAAVLEERNRIARELHDVVGHEVAVMALHAEAAASALDVAPRRARAPIDVIRDSAHHTLHEMRQVLDGLRDECSTLRTPPGVDDLSGLVRRSQQAGADVTWTVSGQRRPSSPSVELTLYRIVQEALTNAHRHAPGRPVEVSLTWGSDRVSVHASNPTGREPAHDPASGLGLLGMAERVRLLGGDLSTGPDGAGTFRVTAHLPLARAGAT